MALSSLASGQALGPYRIIAKIGKGGMGEVYRASDSRLKRDVAMKVLPDLFASDSERVARFSREAQVLASLNHPYIAQLYGLEQTDHKRALVMEFVEGPTLAERIAQGRMPLDEALPIAKQIAEALEYAHEQGVIHRDLKPGNIKVAANGCAKLLDFGLSKALGGSPAAGDISASPTITAAASQGGLILGTPAYMSPEQARGKSVDRHADIWAFGAVLYEMLTGKAAFAGETVSDILAAVIRGEPDWKVLPPDTPPRVRELLRRCLTKDVRQRLRDIGEARIVAEQALSGASSSDHALAPSAKRPWPMAALTVSALIAIVTLIGWWHATLPVSRPLTRLDVDLGPGAIPNVNISVAISPDGRRIVFPVRGPTGKQVLATRLLDQTQATPLPGTEGGTDPFFSLDGQWIGFFAGTQLKKISAQGGAPILLGTPVNQVFGATWMPDGNIVAALGSTLGLSWVSATPGKPQDITTVHSGELTHRWPQVLPDGTTILFTASVSANSMENASVEAASLKTGQVKTLVRGGYFGRYLPTGHLVYLHQGVLFGVKLDPWRLELKGTPVPLLDDVASNPATGGGQFDFSNDGTFVYASGKNPAQLWHLSWLSSSGKTETLTAPGDYGVPRLSPDGRKVAFLSDGDICVEQLETGTRTRLTFGADSNVPVWTPDGKHILFSSQTAGLLWIRSDGAGEPQHLSQSSEIRRPWSVSPDGQVVAYFMRTANSAWEIWTMRLDLSDPEHPRAGKPEPFLLPTNQSADRLVPRFSPDARWIAYRSNESGVPEIYVQPFPISKGGKWQISSGGGLYAVWSSDGRELFYETPDYRIMVVDYTVNGGSFVPGKPRLWSDRQLFYPGTSNFDLAPDGKRFLVMLLPETDSSEKSTLHVTMLLNFFDELKRRIP